LRQERPTTDKFKDRCASPGGGWKFGSYSAKHLCSLLDTDGGVLWHIEAESDWLPVAHDPSQPCHAPGHCHLRSNGAQLHCLMHGWNGVITRQLPECLHSGNQLFTRFLEILHWP